MSTCDPRDIFPQGTAGQYLVAGGGITISNNASWQQLDLNLSGNKEFRELTERISGIEKRLAILRPNWELQARFPALQEAYDAYRLIEKMVDDQNKNMVLK